MKKSKPVKRRARVSEELRPEYRFDHAKAKPNRFAATAVKDPLVVVLDEEIARVFRTPEAVVAVLRAIVSAMPKRGQRNASKPAAEG